MFFNLLIFFHKILKFKIYKKIKKKINNKFKRLKNLNIKILNPKYN